MPYQMPHSCNFPDCRTPVPPGQSCCPAHSHVKRVEKNATDRFRNKTNKTRQWEMSSAWRTVRDVFIRRNPMCQAIEENGEQCRNKSEVAHHLIAPDVNWELRIDWKNLVGVCKGHHITTPGDSGQLRYVPTVLFDGTEFAHHRPLSYLAVTGKHEPLAMIGTPGKQFTASSVGEDAIDAALYEPI